MSEFISLAWECPKCHAVMSPFKDSCVNCTGTSVKQFPPILNEFEICLACGKPHPKNTACPSFTVTS